MKKISSKYKTTFASGIKKNCPSNRKYVALKNKLQARAVGVLSPRKKKKEERKFKKNYKFGLLHLFSQ